MTITVEIAEAETRLLELFAKVEAGEDIIFARGKDPIARLSRVRRPSGVEATIKDIRAARRNLPKTTMDELVGWNNEDRR